MRRLHPALAACAGVLGFGYVYVGRIGLAIAVVAAGVGVIAFAGWTRLILKPTFLYVFAAVGVLMVLLQIVHPALIAARNRNARRKTYNRWWFYIGWIVVVQLSLEAVLTFRSRLFGYETFRIPSASMAPTLEDGDFVIVDSWRYSSEEPALGDVVVYQPEPPPGISYVKRVVGVPGDEIEVRGGTLFRNGEAVPEPYIQSSSWDRVERSAPATLAAGEYYVLGDNRGNSMDSRIHGPVPVGNILGRVEYIGFSTASWQRFPVRLAHSD